MDPKPRSIWKAYGYAWVTLGFFIITLIGHWLFGWFAYVSDQQAHAQPIQTSEYLVEMMRDTLENWQSEFLQLLWQVVGLTVLLYVGSPQSKESEDRSEEMLKQILRRVDPKGADEILADIEKQYPSK